MAAHTRLAEYAESLPLIIVMPDAGDSWVRQFKQRAGRQIFEDYLLKDVIAEVAGR